MSERLPRAAVPRHYDLDFTPDLAAGRVRVRERIELDVKRATKKLTLHGAGLDVTSITVRAGGKSIAGSAKPNRAAQTIRFDFEREIPAGTARLDLKLTAELRKSLNGMYLARRDDDKFVVTQFESTDARTAFVCLDEPDAKATFDVAVTAPADWMVVSNQAESAAEPVKRGLVRRSFHRTRPLPTYLVAVCAGPWEASETRKVGSTPVRVLAPRGLGHLAGTSLGIACRTLAALERYFDFPYPFGKVDHIAVPDFAAGAMENAGCITYRETLLLVDPKTISIQQYRDIANVITHELAHHWFGNLVTPVWWSDLWLNESFATWIAERILDDLHPEWHVWTTFENTKAEAFHLDALASTHPIRNQSETVAEIIQQFDAITYNKGAAVLRMLETYLGKDVMRDGIRRYIRRHADGNATGEDLWTALGEASGRDVSRLLSEWITAPGFPVLTARRRAHRVSLSQTRFSWDPKSKPAKGACWQVPIVLRTNGHVQTAVLDTMQSDVELPAGGAEWLVANAESGGFYRTQYDPETLHHLTDALPSLDPAERAGLLGDAWALARAGRSDAARVLDLIDRLGDEPNHVVLGRASGVLRTLDDGIVPAELRPRFHAWIDLVFRQRLDVLGVQGARKEDEGRRMARAVVVDVLGDLVRDPAVRDTMDDAGRRAISSPRSIDPELLPVALKIAARGGDAALFERFERQRRQAPTPQLERLLLMTRAEFEDSSLVRHFLEETLTDAVRSQDLAHIYVRLFQNPAARWHAWHFLRQSFDQLNGRAVWFMWKRIADALPALGTPEGLREVRAFFRQHPLPDTDQGMVQTLEWMTLDLAFRRRARSQVVRWLARRTSVAHV